MTEIELPVGFGMALAQNERAMHRFESLSDDDKKAVIQKTHRIKSRREMHAFVEELAKGTGV